MVIASGYVDDMFVDDCLYGIKITNTNLGTQLVPEQNTASPSTEHS